VHGHRLQAALREITIIAQAATVVVGLADSDIFNTHGRDRE
jgi:hypothetical protein